MTYDQWFKSQQGIAYEGSYLFAEAAWEHQLRRIVELNAENARLRDLLKEARANLYDMCDAAIVYRIDEALEGQP